ncbi:MAG: hypothetical protein HYV76_01655 [Candidatus Vogelbacteria bacterium]|nr:hypothetical protein [Candidatus Vogelbacteria bacterium]
MCSARYDICILSVERVKELINDPKLSDKQIEEIRDGLFMLAEVMFEQWQAERIKAKKEKEDKDNKNEHEKPTGQQQ